MFQTNHTRPVALQVMITRNPGRQSIIKDQHTNIARIIRL
jgi:hypothetical protein